MRRRIDYLRFTIHDWFKPAFLSRRKDATIFVRPLNQPRRIVHGRLRDKQRELSLTLMDPDLFDVD